MVSRAAAVSIGLVADRLVGEPPLSVHPLPWFGRAMDSFERVIYRDDRATGMLYTFLGVLLAVAAGASLPSLSAATFLSVGANSLDSTALEVWRALEDDDLDLARRMLPSLVGRDPSGLEEKEIARAVVESVAENTVDAVVAPVFWGLVAAAPGALCYRAVNTMDAMVGHRSRHYANFGWASAKLDDLAGWLPARITAVLVALVTPGNAVELLRLTRQEAPAHPSPNAGVSEAAFACALGVQLGGENRYAGHIEARPNLGAGRPAERGDIPRAVELSRRVRGAMAMVLFVVVAARKVASRRTVNGSLRRGRA